MGLSYDIISEFVKVTNGNKEKPKEGIVYATIVQASDGKYVKIDGSDLLTPTDTTTDIEDGERVTVMIKDHKATVTGNVTAPSASGNRVDKVVEVVSNQLGVFETVVADKVSTNELEAYKATIENLIVGKADIEDLKATNAEIENLKVKNAEIENAVIDKATIEDLEAVNAVIENLKVKDAEIENLVADKATINDLNAVNADIQNLKAKHALIEDLVADKADIEDLEATNAEIENLKATDARIENLVADKATIRDLEATKAEIEVLDADFAEIKTLVNGNLTSDNILSFNITADKVTMEDAFIKDAMIDTVNAAKINAGRINTNSVVIGSEDGGMRISGATQQFTDKNGNVRIQIGRDASNDFTFALYGEDGQGQIINQNGITASAIADGLIVNDMVSDNAAISGGKLDISSVVTEINNDNTTTIKSNKIYLDEQNQSLEVAFKSLKTQVDTIKDIDSDLTTITDKIQSNTSKIEVNKSSISTLLAEDAAIKKQVTDLEGNVVETTNTLTSKYTTLQQNLDGFKTTVNNTYATKTSVNDVKNNLSSNYSTTSAMNSAIKQKVDEISASISSTYATKNEVKSIDDNIRTNYSTTNQMSSAISVAKDEINLGISQVYETKAEVTNKVTNAVSAIRVGGTNLITKKSGYTYGFLDGANGNPNNTSSLNSNQDFYTNNYFPIKNGETVYFTAYPKDGITSTLQSGVYIHVYNTSKQWIKQVNNVTSAKSKSQVSYKATSDGFIRFSGRGFNDYNHMAEYTTIPTTWSPAPEDIDSAITNAGTSAVETSKSYTDSQIKLSKDSIELGISQTYETKTSVSSQVSTALTSAKSYADTKKSEAISTASSDATSKANNALTSAKSYTDTAKNDLNTAIGKKANSADVYTKTEVYTKTQTDSAIKASKDAIELSVRNTYETKTNVQNKFNDLTIGGVNRALNTGTSYTWNISNMSNAVWSPYSIAEDVRNKQVIIAFDYEATSITKTADSITKFQTSYTNSSGSLVYSPGFDFTISTGNSSGTIISPPVTFGDVKTGNKPLFRFRFDYVSGNFKISKARVLIGSKDLGWASAPEDITSNITQAKNDAIASANGTLTSTIANYYTKTQTDSAIKASKDAINLSVSQTYETKTEVTNKVTNAVNAIKIGSTNLITKKSGYTYGYLDGANGNPNNSSSLNDNQDFYTNKYFPIKNGETVFFTAYPKEGITSTFQPGVYIHVYNTSKQWTKQVNNVSSAKSKSQVSYKATADGFVRFSGRGFTDYNHMAEYSTIPSQWSPAPEDIDTTINTSLTTAKSYADSQIKIAKDAITSSVSNTYETKTNVQNKIDAIQVGGTNLIKKKSGFTYGYLSSSNGSTTNTGSLNDNQDFYTNDYIFVKAGTPIIFSSYPKQGVTSKIQGAVYVHFYNTNKVWQWCKYNITNANQSARVAYTTEGDCYIRFSSRGFNDYNHKAEYGTKATDWSPAPEDIETTVSNLTQRVSTAESKITDTAITNVVKQNFYTKTETNNQITSKGYQTASQVQQTVDALQLKFTQSGGYNRVRNGIFKDGTSQWSKWGGPTVSTKDDTGHSYGKSLVLVTTGTNQGVQQNITDLCSGKNYTLSAYVYTWAANDCGIQIACGGSYYSAKVPSAGSWQRISVTFKATATSATVQIGRGGWGANGQHLFTAIQFEEGDLATTYSPNPNEMYDGIIKMDKDGIKVSTSNGGWTDFTSAGMNVYNKAGNLSLGTRNGGLTYHNKKGYIGFTSESVVNAYDVAGVTISTANAGSYIVLGTSTTTDPFGGFTSTPALSIAKADIGDANTSFYHQGVNLHTTLNVNTKPIKQVGTMYYGINGATRTFESTTGNLCLFGDNGIRMGYYEGTDIVTKFELTEGSDKSTSYIDTYAHWRFHGWSLTDVGNLSIKNNIKMETTATIQFNSTATYPSLIWEASNRLKLYGNDGIDFGYRNGSSNTPIFKISEADDASYKFQSYGHWNFNNWNLDNVGILKPQRLQLPSTYGSNWIGLGTGDGNDYTTYNVKFRTHNGLAFTDNSDSATVIVQGRQGRIMGKNAYYVNCSRSLKSDIRSVISESDVATFTVKEGETLDTNISAETVCDFLDAIDVKTYVTDFKQEGATQECFDIEKGNSLTLGYIADDIAEHPMFKYVGEKTNDGLYAINSNSLTTTLIVGYQQEKRKREQLEQRLLELERLLKGDK